MDENLTGGMMRGSCEMKTGWSLNKLNTLVVLGGRKTKPIIIRTQNHFHFLLVCELCGNY